MLPDNLTEHGRTFISRLHKKKVINLPSMGPGEGMRGTPRFNGEFLRPIAAIQLGKPVHGDTWCSCDKLQESCASLQVKRRHSLTGNNVISIQDLHEYHIRVFANNKGLLHQKKEEIITKN